MGYFPPHPRAPIDHMMVGHRPPQPDHKPAAAAARPLLPPRATAQARPQHNRNPQGTDSPHGWPPTPDHPSLPTTMNKTEG